MTDTLDNQEKTNMPEEIYAGYHYEEFLLSTEKEDGVIETAYRLKYTVDAERAADSKTIAALAEALDMIGSESHDSVAASTAILALKNSAPRIEEAKENQK